MARVICLMFLTAAIRRRISRWLATGQAPCRGRRVLIAPLRQEQLAEFFEGFVEGRAQLVGQGLRPAELVEDRRSLRLEEAGELDLELLDPRRRAIVQLAGGRRVEDRDLLLDGQGLVLRLLDYLAEFLAAGQ